MSEEKFLTLHPAGKNGVNILKRRYDFIREYVLKVIKKEKKITFKELCKRAENDLEKTFDGKITWYVVSVKLDLEARGIIERIPKTSPHELRMK